MMKNLGIARVARIFPVVIFMALLHPSCTGDTPVDGDSRAPYKNGARFDFSDYLHTAAQVETPGKAAAVAAAAGMAYVAAREAGLQVVDVGTPWAPVARGSIDTTGTAWDVAAVDSIAYVAFGSSGFVVVDVGDPDRPVIVGGAPTPGRARGIAVQGAVAYVADDVVGLMLFDITDPTTPTPMGVENSAGRAVDVAVCGAVAYVADELAGVRVVNAANPWEPWLVNAVSVPGTCGGVAVFGGVLYVAAGSSGLHVVDVSTLGAESIVGTVDIHGDARAVTVGDGVVFVAGGLPGLAVVDAKTPSAPDVVNRIVGSGEANGVDVSEGTLFVAEGSEGLRIVDVSNPLPPPLLASLAQSGGDEVSLVDAQAATAFAVGSSTGLFGAKLERPVLTRTGSTSLPFTEAKDLVVRDGIVYVAAGMNGIHTFDVADGGAITHTGALPYGGNVEAVDVVDSLVYFVTGGTVFGIYRLGDEASVTTEIPWASGTAVAVGGEYAYVASDNRQMHVVYVANPDAPVAVLTGALEGSGVDVFVDGGYVYFVTSNEFSGGENGVGVYDLAFPFKPASVSFLRLSGGPIDRPVDAAILGSTLYLALGRGGLQVVDASDPANPIRIGSYASADVTTGVSAAAGAVFVADGAGGLFAVPSQQRAPLQ